MQNNKWLVSLKSVVVSFLAVLVLVGCVTDHQDGVLPRHADKKKLLELHVQMALGYVGEGNREAARHHLTRAFEIDKNSAPATNAMAMLYQLEGEPALAEEQFKLALKRDKDFTLARNNYGVFLFNQKRYEEAYAEFEKASNDLGFADRGQVLANVGRAAMKLGNMTRAQAAFEHASILDKNNASVYLELADIHLQKQEYADAKKNLDMFTSLADHTARSLMIGIRLERVFGNRDKEASLALLLKNRFPYSNEYLDYKQNLVN